MLIIGIAAGTVIGIIVTSIGCCIYVICTKKITILVENHEDNIQKINHVQLKNNLHLDNFTDDDTIENIKIDFRWLIWLFKD